MCSSARTPRATGGHGLAKQPTHAPDLSTASLAAGYVETCRNPARDVKAWLAASDEAAPTAPSISEVANYVQLCQNPAKDWRAWLAEINNNETRGGTMTTWKAPTGFAASHCMNCKAGWIRTKEEGALIICLLDRQPIPSNLTTCSRYEAKDE